MPPQLDEAKLHNFIGKMLGDLGGAMGVPTVRLGLRLGLHDAPVNVVGALVVLVWRLLAIWRKWQAPIAQGPASV